MNTARTGCECAPCGVANRAMGGFGVDCTLPCVGWDEYKDGATSLRNQRGRERGCMLIDRTYVEDKLGSGRLQVVAVQS